MIPEITLITTFQFTSVVKKTMNNFHLRVQTMPYNVDFYKDWINFYWIPFPRSPIMVSVETELAVTATSKAIAVSNATDRNGMNCGLIS